MAEALAARPDVARVEGNPHIQNQLPQPGPVEDAPPYLQRPDTIEPGINYTHAPQVWALGIHRAEHCYCQRRYRRSLDA